MRRERSDKSEEGTRDDTGERQRLIIGERKDEEGEETCTVR